jgi:hypothetical protein
VIQPELYALLTQTVKAYAPAGTDGYGYTSYDTVALVLPCHIEGRMKEVVDKQGEAVISTGRAILGDVYLGLNDQYRLEVPDPSTVNGWKSVNIIAVETHYDENGPYNQTIYYGEL